MALEDPYAEQSVPFGDLNGQPIDPYAPDMGTFTYPWSQPGIGDIRQVEPRNSPTTIGGQSITAAPAVQQGELATPVLAPPDAGVDPNAIEMYAPDGSVIPPGTPAPGQLDQNGIDQSAIEIYPNEPGAQPGQASPPPPGAAPDAVTGGLTPQQQQLAEASAQIGHAVPGETPGMPDMPHEYYGADTTQSVDQSARELAKLSPAELATREIQDRHAAESQARTAKLEAIQAREQAQQEDYFNWQKAQMQAQAARQQIEQDAQKIAKLDPNRHWENMSALGKIGTVLGSIVGGAGGAYLKTGRNVVMEQVNRDIDADIAAQQHSIAGQRSDIERRQRGVSEDLSTAADQYHQAEVYRQGVYQRAMDTIATKMQDYDPRGQVVTELAKSYQGFAQQKAQSLDAFQQRDLKNRLDIFKAQSEADARAATAAKERADTAKILGQIGGGGGGGGIAKPEGTQFQAVYPTMNDVPAKDQARAFRLPSKNGVPGGWVIANSTKSAEDATNLVGFYSQLNHDLDGLQKISLEREGQRSGAGAIWKKWRDNNEQHYRQLVLDAANTYGMMIHGRAPTSGVLEEVLKEIPELKSFWETGDTTKLLGNFRDDVDNRMTLRLQALGYNGQITSDRPHIEEPNLETIKAPLLAPPVKGDAGWARPDVTDFNDRLSGMFSQYQQNPGLGGGNELNADYDKVARVQRQAIDAIQSDAAAIQAKAPAQRTPQETARLGTAPQAIADRQQMLQAAIDAKHNNLERARQESERQRVRSAVGEGAYKTITSKKRGED